MPERGNKSDDNHLVSSDDNQTERSRGLLFNLRPEKPMDEDRNKNEDDNDSSSSSSSSTSEEPSPLYLAIEAKDASKTRQILTAEDAPDPNESLHFNGQRPLYFAAYTGFTAGVSILLSHGADPNLPNMSHDGYTPLYACAVNGAYGTGDSSKGAAKPSLDTYEAFTAGISLLIEHGADPNGLTRDGATPLYGAALHGDSVTMKVLIDNGADVNFVLVHMDSKTALHAAAESSSRECLRMLLKNGADPNKETRLQNVTPLFIAAQKGHSVCVKHLIYQGGADWNIPNRDGVTPLYAASKQVDKGYVRNLVLWNYSRRMGKSATGFRTYSDNNRTSNTRTGDSNNEDDDDNNDDSDDVTAETSRRSSSARQRKSSLHLRLDGQERSHELCFKFLLERGDPNPLRKAIELSNEELVETVLIRQHMGDDGEEQKLDIRFLKERNFILFKPCGREFMVFLLTQQDLPWKAKQIILDRAMKEVDDEAELLEYLHATLEDLSAKSIEHDTIFLLMMDLYFYIVWIATFGVAVTNHFQGGPTYIVGMVVVSIYFLIRESFEIVQSGYSYIRDYWNWVNATTIVLVLITAAEFASGKSLIPGSPDFDTRFQAVVMSAGAFICLSFVGYLKVTFVAFSEFVGGLVQIMVDLLPFATITLIVLLGFAFMYYIQNFGEEGFTSYGESFLSIFTLFVSGLEETRGPLDLIFGILSVVILLNVVIAIVSSSWESAVESSLILLCKYRLELLRQVDALRAPIGCLIKISREDLPIDIEEWDDNYNWFIEHRIIPPPEHRGEEWWHLELTEKERKAWKLRMRLWKLYSVPMKFLIRLFIWLAGLVTFGLYWPKKVREVLFGIASQETAMSKKQQEADEGERGMSEQLIQIKKQNESITRELGKLRKDVQARTINPSLHRHASGGLNHPGSDPPRSLETRIGRIEEQMDQLNSDMASIQETNKEILRLLILQSQS